MDVDIIDAGGVARQFSGAQSINVRGGNSGGAVKAPISTNVSAFAPGLCIGVNDARLVTELGGKSARVGMYCDSFFQSDQTVWPTPGSTDDAATKRTIDEAIAQGIKPVLLTAMHSKSPTQDAGGHGNMDRLLELLLSPGLYRGKVDLELTNEPDVGAGPHWEPGPLAAYYVHHYPRIKALDPNCKVTGPAFDGCSGVSGGTLAAPTFGQPGMSYVNTFMAAAAASVDVVAYHIYYQLSPEWRYRAIKAWSNAYPTKDLAITESGWHLTRAQAMTPNEAQAGCNGDAQLHASRTSRDLLLQSCVPRMRYSQLYRARDSVFQVFDGAGADTATSLALKDICRALRDSTQRRLYQIGTGDILRDVLVVCMDFADGTQKVAAWCNAGAATLPVLVSGSAPAVRKVIGVAGAVDVAFAAPQARIDVQVNTRPVLLSNVRFPEFSRQV